MVANCLVIVILTISECVHHRRWVTLITAANLITGDHSEGVAGLRENNCSI